MSLRKSESLPIETVNQVFTAIFSVQPEILAKSFQKVVASIQDAECTVELANLARHLQEYRDAAENYSVH